MMDEWIDEDSSQRQSSVVMMLTVDDKDEGIELDLVLGPCEDENMSDDEDGCDEDIVTLDDSSELLDSVIKSAMNETELLTKN
jgi:hypothetical protein